MTEDEAKTKWCPFVRVVSASVIADKMSPTMNRMATDGDPILNPPTCRCIGSECMAWRWNKDNRKECGHDAIGVEAGYCGLAGKP